MLSEELQMNLEMVALSTTGSDYLEPIRSLSDCPKTVRLVYGFDHSIPRSTTWPFML